MKKAIIIGSIVVLIGGAGYYFYTREINKLYNMNYEFVGIQFENLSLATPVMNIRLKITSDSTLEAQLSDLDLDVYINGAKIGKITDVKKIIIPAKGYSFVDIKVALDSTELMGKGFQLIADIYKAKDATLTLKGTTTIKSAFLSFKNTKIDYTESIKYLLS